MSGYLLDTKIISELIKPKPEAKLTEWVDSADEDLLYLSVLTMGEIRKGIVAMEQGRRRIALQSWLEADLQARFSGRVLAVDAGVADRWGIITGRAASRGVPVPVIDGLLAATAIHHNLTLVTRNSSHVVEAGVLVFDPWES